MEEKVKVKKIYDRTKSFEIVEPNMNYGHLEDGQIQVGMTEAVEAVEEEGYEEVVAEYPETGGRETRWVVTREAVEARASEPIMEDIHVYVSHYADAEIEDIEKAKKHEEEFGQCYADLELIETRMVELQFDLSFSFAGGRVLTLTAKKDEYRRLYVKRAELLELVRDDEVVAKSTKRLEELIPEYVRG